MKTLCAAWLLAASVLPVLAAPLPTLIIDGQNNHDWKATTPVMKKDLEATGLFSVEVATAPGGNGPELAAFQPDFAKYKVVVMNYNGAMWSDATCQAFEAYVAGGGGLVVVHAADNSFPKWPAYNAMIAVGGWSGRDDTSGAYLRWKDGKQVLDTQPGTVGHHGAQHPFVLETRSPKHPIMAGLPENWLHPADELYDFMRGPAKNATILATAFADTKFGGSGEHEALLIAIDFGKGRVFHTMIGHGTEAMQCVGFITTLQRGTEWAATGKVTQPVPADFPKPDAVSLR
ncbi:MAG: ThuA domain-containing protein [Verrucomicrobia bacterium]|nr:MAG: ThuA domain-containing protein [Verrucomicrobiota bacterium]